MPPIQLPPFFRDTETLTVGSSGFPYHLADLKIPEIRDEHNIAGRGIKIGFVDTGIDYKHDEFGDRVEKAVSFIRGENGKDRNDHGTHVASTAAGRRHGYAPEATILSAQVLNSRGYGNSKATGQGIEYLAQQGCHIISASLGSSGDDPYTKHAVEEAIAAGVIVVAATGNERARRVSFPARHCIAIGAVDRNFRLASFSNTGVNVDLVGFGVGITAGVPGGYATFSGTSMSTPGVAGLFALRLSAELEYYGEIRTSSVQELLNIETYTLDLGDAGKDRSYGRGFPDVKKALVDDFNTPPVSPEDPTEEPPFGTLPVSINFDVGDSAMDGLWTGSVRKEGEE